jgi:hypothetical protein
MASIEGIITTADGQTRRFLVALGGHGELSACQWGNTTGELGDTVDLLAALTVVAAEQLGPG